MATRIYGYARVSATDQNLERQLDQLRHYITDERYIICDKASGKNFDRRGYNSLVGTKDTAPLLNEGDLLNIHKHFYLSDRTKSGTAHNRHTRFNLQTIY